MNESVAALSPVKELVIFGICLVAGVVGLPALAFAIGQIILGQYAGGGLVAIIAHEFRGLGSGATSSWVIALAPYVLVLIARLIWNCDRVHRRLWPDRDSLTSKHGDRPGDV